MSLSTRTGRDTARSTSLSWRIAGRGRRTRTADSSLRQVSEQAISTAQGKTLKAASTTAAERKALQVLRAESRAHADEAAAAAPRRRASSFRVPRRQRSAVTSDQCAVWRCLQSCRPLNLKKQNQNNIRTEMTNVDRSDAPCASRRSCHGPRPSSRGGDVGEPFIITGMAPVLGEVPTQPQPLVGDDLTTNRTKTRSLGQNTLDKYLILNESRASLYPCNRRCGGRVTRMSERMIGKIDWGGRVLSYSTRNSYGRRCE